jgi:hypothetical protein
LGRVAAPLALSALGLLQACITESTVVVTPAESPPVVVRTDASAAPPLRFGSPVAAEISSGSDFEARDCLSARLRLVRLPGKPRLAGGAPLDHFARAIIDPGTGESRLAPVLATGAVLVEGDAVEEIPLAEGKLLGDLATALPPRATLRIEGITERPGTAPIASALPAPLVEEKVGLLVARAATGALDLALLLEGSAPPPVEPDVPAPQGAADDGTADRIAVHARASVRERRELVALRRVADRIGVVVPSPYQGEEAWVAIVLEVSPAPLPGEPGASRHEIATLAVKGKLAAERAEVLGRRVPGPPVASTCPSATLEEQEAELARWPRRGLTALAESTGAVLALDAAIGCTDASLDEVVVAVKQALAQRRAREAAGAILDAVSGPTIALLRTLPWDLDVATLGALLSATNRAGARSLLERRYGAAFGEDLDGTGTGLLPRALLLRSHVELDAAVLERNLLELEDTRPRTRIVAARWLATLDPSLEGYDPLGPFEERRQAVDRLWQRLAPGETP